jgi:hypothetical protein
MSILWRISQNETLPTKVVLNFTDRIVMKLLVLSILLSAPCVFSSPAQTQDVAALTDYNSFRIYKMRSLLELKTSPKMYILKVA